MSIKENMPLIFNEFNLKIADVFTSTLLSNASYQNGPYFDWLFESLILQIVY